MLLNEIAEEQKRAVHTIDLSRSAWYLELWLPYAVPAATTHRPTRC
jgi:ACT domain-containing protein